MSSRGDPRLPVLVGIGTCSQREDDFARAREPLDLMLEAVRLAGIDAGGAHTLAGVGRIAVPKGRWRYRNPAGEIARAIGAPSATTVLASVGVLQQSLIGDACSRIDVGEQSGMIDRACDPRRRRRPGSRLVRFAQFRRHFAGARIALERILGERATDDAVERLRNAAVALARRAMGFAHDAAHEGEHGCFARALERVAGLVAHVAYDRRRVHRRVVLLEAEVGRDHAGRSEHSGDDDGYHKPPVMHEARRPANRQHF